jgi:hypothetical protein
MLLPIAALREAETTAEKKKKKSFISHYFLF